MPLSQGFNAKGINANKRGLKSLRLNNVNAVRTRLVAPFFLNDHESQQSNRKLNVPLTQQQQQQQQKQVRQQQLHQGQINKNLQLSYILGESLARHGRLQEAFNLYALTANEQYEGFIPLEKLHILATALIEHVRSLVKSIKKSEPMDMTTSESLTDNFALMNGQHNNNSKKRTIDETKYLALKINCKGSAASTLAFNSNSLDSNVIFNSSNSALNEDLDPLLCPLCRDILRCPVTTNCGHTFCRQCCDTITMCNICHVKFSKYQRDELFVESNHTKQATVDLTRATAVTVADTLTTTTTTNTSNSIDSNIASSNLIFAYPPPSSESPPSSTFLNNTSNINGSSNFNNNSGYNSLSPNSSSIAVNPSQNCPITTTSVALTTDTATTTMAAASSTSLTSGTNAININRINGNDCVGNTTSSDNIKFMPDVLVRRLVEKWWGADLQAKKICETAASYMHLNLLDDALKFCNASLEKSPTNFKSLLLRAEVLRKMNHYQSSLADVDNALKTHYTSVKAHYMRALALSSLGRFEEALYETCLAIALDKVQNLTNTELFQHDLTKILQKLLSQTPKCCNNGLSPLDSKLSYNVYNGGRYVKRKKFNSSNSTTVTMNEEETNNYGNSFDKRHHYQHYQHHHTNHDEDIYMKTYEEENDDDDNEDDEDFLSVSYAKECDILADDVDDEETEDDPLICSNVLNCLEKRSTYAGIAKKYEMELRKQTSRKHFRRKWLIKDSELLPNSMDKEAVRCCNQFRNILQRTHQEILRLNTQYAASELKQEHCINVPSALIDPSDFDCVLCCRTLWKPVVTPCGHTYCLVCLDRCMDYTSSCPLCMSPLVELTVNPYQQSPCSSPLPLVLSKRPVTKFLEAAMQRFIPDIYNKRLRQDMITEPSVPIFICTPAYPNVPCPLFVYEPRYRLMVRRAVESGEKQFGIVQPHSGKTRYYNYGTILDIRDCVLLGDGCSILSTIGCKRFKILARHEKDGYETAKVEYIYDEAIPEEHLEYISNMHSIVWAKAIKWYDSLSEDLKHEILQSYGEMPPIEDNWELIADGPAWAWWIIALLPLRPQLKVDILATTSLEKRLRAIEKTINSMSDNYRCQRVSSNGSDVAVTVVHTHPNEHSHEHEVIEHEDTNVTERHLNDFQSEESLTGDLHQNSPQRSTVQSDHHTHHQHANSINGCIENESASALEICANESCHCITATTIERNNEALYHHVRNVRNEHNNQTPPLLL